MKRKVILVCLITIYSISLSAQQLSIILPKDGSFIQTDSTRLNLSTLVKWTENPYSELNFVFTLDNGQSWIPMELSTYFPDDTTAIWYLPDTTSQFCKVKLILKSDSSIYVMNKLPFTLYFIDYDYISTNEIFMWIGNSGMGSHDPRSNYSGFYWPTGDSATLAAIFVDGLVWGGEVNGEIKVNGNTWRNGLQPGRIFEDGNADNPILYKIYKIRKDWQTLPESNLRDRLEYDYNHWPIEAGAPWVDVNEDGVYTPGFDKPKFIGDETLFYVANDLDTATSIYTYGSNPIGLEFQTTVFGFNRNDLKDVVFKKYKVINKSKTDVKEMYFTYFADNDMGYASDDFVGCDSSLSLGYTWNSDNDDDYGYGLNPPAIGHMIVQGPRSKSSVETDSALFNGSWMKGFRNIKMTSFGPNFKNSSLLSHDPPLGVYDGTLELYNNLMRGRMNDGSYFINPHTGVLDTFALSGDPVTGMGWYEGTGWPGGPYAGDRRYWVNCGPFNLAAGDTQEIVIAIPIARGTDNINSITKLRELAAHVQEFYNTELVEILNTKETIAPTGYTLYQNYPNPFNPKTTIEYEVPEKTNVTIKIYDILGREVKTLVDNEEKVRWKYKVEFDASTLSSGVYFYRIQAGSFTQTKKMMVLK